MKMENSSKLKSTLQLISMNKFLRANERKQKVSSGECLIAHHAREVSVVVRREFDVLDCNLTL